MVMKRVVAAAALLLMGSASWAAGGTGPLDSANNDVSNVASLQRGARHFVNYCIGCHSAQYVRYNRLAEDLELTEEQLVENLMFTGQRTSDTMTNAMDPELAARWFGQAPPDLSLTARSRGTDWIYTFLRSFYKDDSTLSGANNRLLENTSMPHVLWELQGIRGAIYEPGEGDSEVFVGYEQLSEGLLDEAEYDQMIRDIVNFLDYTGEPMQVQRQQMGIWVIAFLLVFMLFAYLLKKEIWKDVAH